MVVLWSQALEAAGAELAQMCLGGNKIRKEKMSGEGGEEVATPFKSHNFLMSFSPVLH